MPSKQCDACGMNVDVVGHRDFGAHQCVKAGTDATSEQHKPCPTHGGLVWIVGPYSTYRICGGAGQHCTAGKRGKPWRYCAPRGQAISSNTQSNESDDESEPSVVTTPNVTPKAADALAQLLSALTPAAPVLDESKVAALVNAAVDRKLQERVSVDLIVKRPDVDHEVKIEHPHPYLARVIKLVNAGLPVYLWGPAGSGKTTAGMQVAKALGRKSEIDTLDPSTFRSMVQGYCTPTGEPVHTSFTRCWSSGKIYIADEADNAPGHVQTLFNSALANGHAPLAWGNAERSESFAFIATGNTPGRPTRAFPDRKPMSAAFADRLYFVHWPLDEQSERAWAGVTGKGKSIAQTAPRSVSKQAWVDFVQKLREWATTNAPTLMITPRASLTGLVALECGESPEQVADGLIFRGADDEIVRKALAAVKLP